MITVYGTGLAVIYSLWLRDSSPIRRSVYRVPLLTISSEETDARSFNDEFLEMSPILSGDRYVCAAQHRPFDGRG